MFSTLKAEFKILSAIDPNDIDNNIIQSFASLEERHIRSAWRHTLQNYWRCI